jgi:hypothetical protein
VIRFTSAILSLLLLSTILAANDSGPIYDDNYATTTKEAVMLSQLLAKGDSLKIDVSGSMTGKRSFFSLPSDDDKKKWKSEVSINVDIDTCYSEDTATSIANKGYVLKSRVSDSTVVGYREAIDLLKANGAKYVYVQTSVVQRDPLSIWKRQEPMPFQKYKDMMISRNPSFTDDELKRDHDVMVDQWKAKEPKTTSTYQKDESPDEIVTNKAFKEYFEGVLADRSFEKSSSRFLPVGCFQDRSVKASDFFWLGGQLAVMTIGLKGASSGNTAMASLAAHGSNAVENTTNLMQNGNTSTVDSKRLSLIALNAKIAMVGLADEKYFIDNFVHFPDYKSTGYIFPISDIEECLSHYKVIPYNVKKITSN